MDPFIGQIDLFPYDFAPRGWMACEGQILPVQQNQALFALIRNRFGGDGTTTFALPDMRGKAPVPNMRYFIAYLGMLPPRE